MPKPLTEYQQKKLDRRAKQREANGMRAEKMHVARLAFEAEGKKPRTAKLKGKLHIACSGWFYWDWKGKFYPQQMPTSEWFAHYQEHFNTVELNAPFYSWPTPGTVKTWVKQAAAEDFIYTVKACELITHVKQFKGTKELVKDFGLIADMLGPKMGCFLFQLPPSYHYSAAKLKAIVSQLDPTRRNVVEFRHASWWNEKVYAAFREAGIIFCCCSGPKLPDDLVKTADEIYVRFHGTEKWYRHNYSDAELQLWADKIKAAKAKKVWAYFNNDFDGYAIANAKTLEGMLK